MDLLTMQVAQTRHRDMLREAEQRHLVNSVTRANRAERRLFHIDLGKLHIDVTFDRPTPVAQM